MLVIKIESIILCEMFPTECSLWYLKGVSLNIETRILAVHVLKLSIDNYKIL